MNECLTGKMFHFNNSSINIVVFTDEVEVLYFRRLATSMVKAQHVINNVQLVLVKLQPESYFASLK